MSRFVHGDLEIAFHPEVGGRLAGLRYRGMDLVVPPGQPHGFYGDVLWPSPQSLFDWPPPQVLDSGPYEVLAESETSLTLRSAPDEDFGLQVTKHTAWEADSLTFDCTLTNIWDREHAVAPWQVTRAPRTGLVLWASGEPFDDEDRRDHQRADPGCRYVHADVPVAFETYATSGGLASIRPASVTTTSKLFTDARGWVAHVHDGVVLLKVFPDLTPAQMAPRQAEVELYVGVENDYIELENQGNYRSLPPGESLTYTVRWRCGVIDPAVPTEAVTPELRAAVDALLAG